MNPFEMVVAIVGIGAVASVMRAKYGHGSGNMPGWRGRGHSRFVNASDASLVDENNALRDEMRGLKDRIQVLERLATDDESDARGLDREIEKLRDTRATDKDLNRE